MLKGFLGKFSGEQRSKLSETYGCHWEKDEDCAHCRECGINFTVTIRRHHCRGCGGIYCEQCCARAVVINGESLPACSGCARGETPGEAIKLTALSLAVDATGHCGQATACKLNEGAEFGSESTSGKLSGASATSTPPSNGYFEFANKSDSFVCLKLIIGGHYINEMSRPSYISVAPSAIVSGHFDPTATNITLLILVDNPSPPPTDGRVILNTNGMYKTSACAATENFRHILIFKVNSLGRNALLKLKPGCVLELRKGSSMKRMGLMGVFTGSTPTNEINFDTNATDIEGVYNSMR